MIRQIVIIKYEIDELKREMPIFCAKYQIDID